MMQKNHRTTPAVNLNLNVRGLGQSATLRINQISAELQAQGQKIYRLGLGQSPFPVPQPVVEELRVNAHQKDYLQVDGLRQLRAAVAAWHDRIQGLDFTENDILIGPGSKELMFLLQLVYYGDLVIPTPSWVSYAPQAHIIGRHVRWLSTKPENHWLLMPEELEKLCQSDPDRPRLVILNYPSNPTGWTYNIEELKALAAVAKKYRVILLSDEIYGEIHHKGKHISIARFYPGGTIVSTGLSKWCGAGGWRLGIFSFPKNLHWLKDAMAAVASETFTSTSAPIQYAAVRAFEGGTVIEHYLWKSRRILAALGEQIFNKLNQAGVNLSPPLGAFYLFPDFSPFRDVLAERGIQSSSEFCDTLLRETGVAILPGENFGRPEHELTARLAYVDFDGARALEAMEQLPAGQMPDEQFMEMYAPNVVTSIDKIVAWLKN